MGGGGSTGPQVITTPRPNDTPLEGQLTGLGTRQLGFAEPFSYYGAGYNLLPQGPLGQVGLAGPNPTIFGQPFNPQAQGGYWGNVSQYGGGGAAPQQGAGLLSQMQQIFGGSAFNPIGGTPSGQSGGGGGSSSAATSATANGGTGGNQGQAAPAQPTAGSSWQSGSVANHGFGNGGNGTINPGQVLPNSGPGDKPVLPPQPGPNDSTRSSFLSPNLTAPYYNLAGVAGNLGTAAGSAVPGAANYLQQVFNPNLNQFEQASLAAGNANASKLLEQAMVRAEGQSENSPYHDAIGQVQGEVANQYARDALQTAGNMGIARQQLAAGLASTPFDLTLQNAQVGSQVAERMFNMANTAYQQPYQEPNQIYSQVPLASQTLIPGTQQSSGGFKF